MRGKTIFLISVLATMAVLFGGCATEDKVANDIRRATKTAEPYDHNYDFSDMKDKTGLGRGNGEGYWGYTTNNERVKNTTNQMTNKVKNATNEVNNRLTQTPNTAATGGRISPNTATDSQYQNPYLYGNSKAGDQIADPVVMAN